MIVSYKHKFIFIKTRKVAGTSIEAALSTICGPDDIVTPISVHAEIQRLRLGGAPQNFSDLPALEKEYRAAALEGNIPAMKELLSRLEKSSFFLSHSTAVEVKKYVSDEFWNEAFKFTIDREPFDQLVSLYFYTLANKKRPAWIPNFVRLFNMVLRTPRNSDFYTKDGQPIVDHVMRYDRLDEEFSRITQRLGFGDLSLPMLHSGFRPKGIGSRELFGPVTRAIIRFRWRREFRERFFEQ